MYTIEEFDKEKTKILRYVLYKKRTEKEVKQKFLETDDEMLNDIINDLKEKGYIDDSNYIEKQVNEFMKLKTLSIKEIKYKLLQKGLNKSIIEDYIDNNREALEEYEKQGMNKIKLKKSNNMEEDEIKNYLLKRGFRNNDDF